MGIGRRLFDLVRANVGHYLRSDETAPPRQRWRPPPPGSEGPRAPGPEAPPGPPRGSDPLRRAYRALELPFGAGPDAVRHAHRQLMRRYHPDNFARDPERLADATRLAQELTEARDLLLDALDRGVIVARPG